MSLINVDLSDTIATWKNKTNQIASNLGDLALLNDSSTSIVTAINNLQNGYDSDIASLDSSVLSLDSDVLSLRTNVYGGTFSLSALTTTNKSSIIAAINGLQSETDSDILRIRTHVYGATLSLSALTTTDKSSIIGAINEVDSDVLLLRGNVYGDSGGILNLSALTTTNKNSIIAAINELDRRSIDIYNASGILLNT